MDNEEHHHRRHCPHWASERRSTEAATATRNMSRFARDLARVQDCCVILFVSLFLSFPLSTLSIAASSIQQSQRKREGKVTKRERPRFFHPDSTSYLAFLQVESSSRENSLPPFFLSSAWWVVFAKQPRSFLQSREANL